MSHVWTCRLLRPFRHQVVADRSDMDRDFEVSGGGANGATPTDELSSKDLGMWLIKIRHQLSSKSDEVLTILMAFIPPV